ncbi:hypothetical protein [Candidatus Pelagibacter sp. HIMB1587]|uniref:hypothetical protein n=1 Tax=Candidatus Pelagibacter sp. HIMB1587 TaxID=3413354 RepID=UPI003F86D2CD
MIDSKLLIVSGVNRSGKSLIAPIVSSFKNVEPFVVNYDYERLLQMAYCKRVNPSFFDFFFKKMSEKMMHDQFNGRNVSIKIKDFSSIWKNSTSMEIQKKIIEEEISKKTFLKHKKKYSNFFIHNSLFFKNSFSKTFKNYKIINIIRHPIDIIYSWRKKNVNKIYNNKNEIFNESFYLKKKKYYLPYYSKNINLNNFQKLNSFEKLFVMVDDNLQEEYKIIDKKFSSKNLIVLDFDNFVSKPHLKIKKIEKFLNCNKSKFTKEVLFQEKCPRKINNFKKIQRELHLLNELNLTLRKKYKSLVEKYNFIKNKYD